MQWEYNTIYIYNCDSPWWFFAAETREYHGKTMRYIIYNGNNHEKNMFQTTNQDNMTNNVLLVKIGLGRFGIPSGPSFTYCNSGFLKHPSIFIHQPLDEFGTSMTIWHNNKNIPGNIPYISHKNDITINISRLIYLNKNISMHIIRKTWKHIPAGHNEQKEHIVFFITEKILVMAYNPTLNSWEHRCSTHVQTLRTRIWSTHGCSSPDVTWFDRSEVLLPGRVLNG